MKQSVAYFQMTTRHLEEVMRELLEAKAKEHKHGNRN